MQELQHALAIQPGTSDLDNDALIHVDILISVCLGIVVVEQDSGNVGLIHFTAQEYFLQHPIHDSWRVEETITQSCLTYLAFNGFVESHCDTNADLSVLFFKYPFGLYAATWWGVHLKNISNAQLLGQALDFLMDDQLVKAAGQLFYDFDLRRESMSSGTYTGLHLAARFGHLLLAQGLLEKTVRCYFSCTWTTALDKSSQQEL